MVRVPGEDVGGEVETGGRVEIAEALVGAAANDVQVGGEGLDHVTGVFSAAACLRRGGVLGAVDQLLLVEVPY